MVERKRNDNDRVISPYLRFALMIFTSMLVMFALMYLHTYSLDHVRWSETRFYMTVIMGGGMVLVMFAFMRSMYSNNTANAGLVLIGVVMILGATWLVRSQSTIDDIAYMRGMIPHHSIAILTSERAQIDDLRVRELADDIIRAQRREIKEMDWLIEDIRQNGPAATPAQVAARPLPEFETSLE
jgi:magnesium-transporting ATPase (P-type)